MTPETHFNLNDLLTLENDPELLAINCPDSDLPAWAFIRLAFMRALIGPAFYASPLVGSNGGRNGAANRASYIFRAAVHNLTAPCDKVDVCFATTGLGNYVVNNKTRDRLVSYFADACPAPSMVHQAHGDWTWPTQFSPPDVYFGAPARVSAYLSGSFKEGKRHREIARSVVKRAAFLANSAIGRQPVEEEVDALARKLSIQMAIFPYAVEHYKRLFLFRKVRLLLLEDGCLGGSVVSLIHAARLAQVVTAEFQHGMISKGHDGYNVGDYLVNHSGYQQSLPQYLLTYGKWWGTQTNIPIVKRVIGNPHFYESVKNVVAPATQSEILVLGDGIDTKSYLSLAHDISTKIAGSGGRVVFRPHPIERDRLKTLDLPPGVAADVNSDIYQSLRHARFVISELSTGLFEATGLGCTPLVWSTPKSRFSMPNCPFQSFSSFDELKEILAKSPGEQNLPSDFWEPDWKSNFIKFVEEVLELDHRNS